MITLKEKQEVILRYYREGDSLRKISRDLCLNRKTVTRYIHKYEQDLEQSEDPVAKDNIVIGSDICSSPSYDVSSRSKRKITQELINEVQYHLDENRKKRLSGRRKQQLKKIDIFEQVKDQGYSIGYTSICNLIRDLESSGSETFIRQSYIPGDECEFDWGEVKIDVGKGIEKYQLAVFTAAYSNYRFAYLFKHQDTMSFQQAHAYFFSHVHGVYKTLVYDNMRVAIKKFVGPSEKEATDGLLKLSMYYHFDYRFCNVRKGNEKGHVERSVEYIRRKAFGFQEVFKSLSEANEYLQSVCEVLNQKPQLSNKQHIALNLFSEEKEFLLSWKAPFVCCDEESLKVDSWSTIRYRSCHYSVPESFNGKMITVRVFPEHIVCISDDTQICRHSRLYGLNEWSLQIEHYTSTLKRKPGALYGSVAFKQIDQRLQLIYQLYFNQSPKEFVELIEYLNGSKNTIDDIERAITKLKPMRADDVSLDRIKIVCDFEDQPPVSYNCSDEIDQTCSKQLTYTSQLFLGICVNTEAAEEVFV